MSIFGMKKKVERVRTALVRALKAKSVAILTPHATKDPKDIPRNDLARASTLHDLAEVLEGLQVDDVEDEA